MITEMLLLQVLIVLIPGFIMSLFQSGKDFKANKTTLVMALLHSIVAVICMSVTYVEYGVPWDFRYIPLMLGFLYGGQKVGWSVLVVMIGYKFLIGWEIMYVISTVLIAIMSQLVLFKFKKNLRRIKKVCWLLFLVLFALLLQYVFAIHEILSTLNDQTFFSFFSSHYFYYFVTFVLTATFSMLLYEMILEKSKILGEIIQTERQNTVAELAASIAHEVRNPLTVVKGFLQLMKEDAKKEDDIEYFNLALSELERAEYIVNDYLDFAKPKLKKIESVSVTKCIQEVVSLLNPMALKENVELITTYQEELNIWTDRYQFKQVIINFMKNAIEAIDDDGKVTVHVWQASGYVYIRISDTGKGMDKQQLEKIGTVYYTTKKEGTGLGTMISIQLIHQMHGNVSFDSQVGKGTDVYIKLPLQN
ncbi:ATP-binding protein [Alkalihalobacillus pseudalcaliphilus]|uniref:ATP-binding protein n=1 Tax=Alkalihalobacillus pseudalcaliphilus TaxID=79884 RepID=UPI00064DB476|nr:ATP-binding protein [Alkalihalobacillus pseudalcaliphilus]KMK75058.1 hypothetical protein AB990_16465 [Alkalihalobacillus pseudalcaliphilus]